MSIAAGNINFQDYSTTAFQKKCDILSKYCVVALGFIIPISTALTYPVLLLLMLSWFLSGAVKEKTQFIWQNAIARSVFLFYGILVVGTFYSKAPLQDITEMFGKMAKLLYIPFLLPLMIEEKWRRLTIKAFIAAMMLTLVLSLLKVYAHLPIYHTRFSNACVFKDHIYTNLLMAFATYVIGHYTLSRIQQGLRNGQKYMLYGLIAALIYYVLFMSEGRSGYVVFVVLWLLFFCQRFKFKGIFWGTLALSLLMGIVFVSSNSFQTRFLQISNDVAHYKMQETKTAVGQRIEYTRETLNLALERPWFGFGTGSFKTTYEEHAKKNAMQITKNPHNEYLNIMLQLGMMGLIAFLALLFRILKNSYQLPLIEKHWAQGALAAIAIGCFANSWIMDFTAGYFFVLMMAVSFGALNLASKNIKHKGGRHG